MLFRTHSDKYEKFVLRKDKTDEQHLFQGTITSHHQSFDITTLDFGNASAMMALASKWNLHLQGQS